MKRQTPSVMIDMVLESNSGAIIWSHKNLHIETANSLLKSTATKKCACWQGALSSPAVGERSNLAARNDPRPNSIEMMSLSRHATAFSNVNPEAVARQAGSLMAESSSAAQLERVVIFFLLNEFI